MSFGARGWASYVFFRVPEGKNCQNLNRNTNAPHPFLTYGDDFFAADFVRIRLDLLSGEPSQLRNRAKPGAETEHTQSQEPIAKSHELWGNGMGKLRELLCA